MLFRSYTTVPAFIISSIAFGLLSPWNKVGNISTVEQFKIDILSTGLVNNLSLICFLILIIFSLFKVPAIMTNKWGWLFDAERRRVNRACLAVLRNQTTVKKD